MLHVPDSSLRLLFPRRRRQLLTSSAVHKWGTEIHEGIYNMLMLLVELVAERVKQDPVAVNLMGVLTMVCSRSHVQRSFLYYGQGKPGKDLAFLNGYFLEKSLKKISHFGKVREIYYIHVNLR